MINVECGQLIHGTAPNREIAEKLFREYGLLGCQSLLVQKKELSPLEKLVKEICVETLQKKQRIESPWPIELPAREATACNTADYLFSLVTSVLYAHPTPKMSGETFSWNIAENHLNTSIIATFIQNHSFAYSLLAKELFLLTRNGELNTQSVELKGFVAKYPAIVLFNQPQPTYISWEKALVKWSKVIPDGGTYVNALLTSLIKPSQEEKKYILKGISFQNWVYGETVRSLCISLGYVPLEITSPWANIFSYGTDYSRLEQLYACSHLRGSQKSRLQLLLEKIEKFQQLRTEILTQKEQPITLWKVIPKLKMLLEGVEKLNADASLHCQLRASVLLPNFSQAAIKGNFPTLPISGGKSGLLEPIADIHGYRCWQYDFYEQNGYLIFHIAFMSPTHVSRRFKVTCDVSMEEIKHLSQLKTKIEKQEEEISFARLWHVMLKTIGAEFPEDAPTNPQTVCRNLVDEMEDDVEPFFHLTENRQDRLPTLREHCAFIEDEKELDFDSLLIRSYAFLREVKVGLRLANLALVDLPPPRASNHPVEEAARGHLYPIRGGFSLLSPSSKHKMNHPFIMRVTTELNDFAMECEKSDGSKEMTMQMEVQCFDFQTMDTARVNTTLTFQKQQEGTLACLKITFDLKPTTSERSSSLKIPSKEWSMGNWFTYEIAALKGIFYDREIGIQADQKVLLPIPFRRLYLALQRYAEGKDLPDEYEGWSDLHLQWSQKKRDTSQFSHFIIHAMEAKVEEENRLKYPIINVIKIGVKADGSRELISCRSHNVASCAKAWDQLLDVGAEQFAISGSSKACLQKYYIKVFSYYIKRIPPEKLDEIVAGLRLKFGSQLVDYFISLTHSLEIPSKKELVDKLRDHYFSDFIDGVEDLLKSLEESDKESFLTQMKEVIQEENRSSFDFIMKKLSSKVDYQVTKITASLILELVNGLQIFIQSANAQDLIQSVLDILDSFYGWSEEGNKPKEACHELFRRVGQKAAFVSAIEEQFKNLPQEDVPNQNHCIDKLHSSLNTASRKGIQKGISELLVLMGQIKKPIAVKWLEQTSPNLLIHLGYNSQEDQVHIPSQVKELFSELWKYLSYMPIYPEPEGMSLLSLAICQRHVARWNLFSENKQVAGQSRAAPHDDGRDGDV